jgi:NAD(P)-dependent dehydrogenase (short-subunit alcohol dehydrogenase family)
MATMSNSQVHLITGAGSGIGQLAARRALRAGHQVAALDVNAQGLAQLGASQRLLPITVDITDASAVRAAVERAEAQLGPVDRLVNAAAIMPLGLLLEQDNATIHRIMAINFGGLVNVAQAVLPGMLQRGRGEFVSFSSSAGHIPVLYMGAYDASKSAVNAFTEVLHHENLNRGVRFCCICPPPVATPLLDQARATVWPKMFDITPAITADFVLDELERGLARGDFWIFPGPKVGLYVKLRRFVPALLWKRVHQVEGR